MRDPKRELCHRIRVFVYRYDGGLDRKSVV